jgi:hypothetical protein
MEGGLTALHFAARTRAGMARKKKDAFMVLTEKCKGDGCSNEMMQLRSAIRLILIPEGSMPYRTCKFM